MKHRRSRKEQWQTIRRTMPDAYRLARPYARLWTLGLILLLVGRTAGLVLPGTPKLLMDHILPGEDMRGLYILVGVVLAATAVQGFCAFALSQTISKAGQRMIADLRMRLQNHVTRLTVTYFDRRKSGEIVSRVMNDVESVRSLVGTGMVEFLGGLITASLAFLILLYLNWKMTLTILLFVGVFLVVIVKSFMILGPIFRRMQEQKADLSGRLTESIGGIRVVKAYQREQKEREIFAEGVSGLLASMMRTINAISALAFVSAVLLGALGSAILLVGGRQLMAGELTTGAFISYLLYLGFLIAPISSILMIGTQLSEVFAGIERMNEVFAERTEEQDDASRKPIGTLTGRVEARAVCFEYDPGRRVLDNVSFVAEPGSVTALVGPSGSGKSTLIGLIASFHRPTEGVILVDGHNLAEVRLSDYRCQLGVVLQENFLFSGTIRENLLYIRPDASDEELIRALQLAHCIEFIDKMESGLETVIGERGVKLSGGQRQRLAIARALLANPRILILDEATSALDSESEAKIQEGLATLMEGRTTFVIAHRLSTIRHATQIFVLEDGRIVERGTHTDLLATGGRYAQMHHRQQGVETNLFLAPGEEEADADETEPPARGEEEDARKRLERLSRFLTGG